MAQTAVQSEVNTTPAEAVPHRWLTVVILSMVQMVENSEGGLVNAVFPIIRADLGLNLANLGILTSVSKFARMIFGPLWSVLADRFGRKLILVITALWGVWTMVAGLAHNFNALLLLYGLGVLGTVAGEPISNGLVGDMFKGDERGKVYGAMRSIGGFGSLIITPLLGQLAGIPGNQGWRYGMFIMGGIGVVSGILSWIYITEPKHEVSDEKFKEAVAAGSAQAKKEAHAAFRLSDIPKLMAIPTVALMAVMLILVTSLVLFAFQVVFYTDVRHFTTQSATLLYSVFFAGFAISSMIGGYLGDWFDRKNPRGGRILLMQIYLVAFAVMSYICMQVNYPKGVLDYVLWLIFGLVASIGFSGCVLPMVSNVILPQYRASAFALLFSLVQGLISAIYSLVLGDLSQRFGLQHVMLYMVTIPYAVNAVFWFVFYKTYPKDKERMHQQLLAQSTETPAS